MIKQNLKNAGEVLDLLEAFNEFSTARKCGLLEVSRKTYFRWLRGEPVDAAHKKAFEKTLDWLEDCCRGTTITFERPTLEIETINHPVEEWLKKRLSNGPKEIRELLLRGKFTRAELVRAAHRIGVTSTIKGFGANRRAIWSLR